MDVIVRFMCSVKAQPFDVHFRPRDGKPAQIVAIETVRPKKPTVWDRLNPFSGGEPPTDTKELNSWDMSRFCCPWCGTERKKNLSSDKVHSSYLCKGCGTRFCLGAWEVRAGEKIECPVCGHVAKGGKGRDAREPLSGKEAVSRITAKSDRLIEKK